MIRPILSVSALALLVGCGDGQPFDFGNTPPTPPNQTSGGTLGGVDLPGGPTTPASGQSIERYELANAQGGGYAQDITYNSGANTFTVDNLAFDGLNTYQASGQGTSATPFATLSGYKVFEADITVPDFLTGNPVGQITPYRAIYGESTTNVVVNGSPQPRTRFGIVRTGGYSSYGFGGFVYSRNGSVVLPPNAPQTGQAIFSGKYAGMRVYDGAGGLNFTSGDMEVSIDFDDFNSNDAIQGRVFHRAAVLSDGTPIIVGNDAEGAAELPLPDLQFTVQAGVDSLNAAGEIAGAVTSTRPANGANGGPTSPTLYETGIYYGILAGDLTGDDGGELVGVLVVTSTDPRDVYQIPVQETGGFILLR